MSSSGKQCVFRLLTLLQHSPNTPAAVGVFTSEEEFFLCKLIAITAGSFILLELVDQHLIIIFNFLCSDYTTKCPERRLNPRANRMSCKLFSVVFLGSTCLDRIIYRMCTCVCNWVYICQLNWTIRHLKIPVVLTSCQLAATRGFHFNVVMLWQLHQ